MLRLQWVAWGWVVLQQEQAGCCVRVVVGNFWGAMRLGEAFAQMMEYHVEYVELIGPMGVVHFHYHMCLV